MSIQGSFRRAAAARLAPLLVALWAATACDQDFVDRGVLDDPEATVSVVSGSDQLGFLGSPMLLRVQVRDSRGRPIPGQRVEFRRLVGEGAFSATSGVTDHAGMTQVAFVPLSEGQLVVEAQQAGSGARATFQLEGFDPLRLVQPGSLEKVAGDAQSGQVGTVLPQPLTVRVTNRQGQPLGEFPVVFTATTDGTELHSINAGDLTQIDTLGNAIPAVADSIGRQIVTFTDGNGIADVLVRLRTRPGTNQVTAALTSAGGDVDVVVFTATGEAGSIGSADSIAKISGDEQNVTQDTTGIGTTPSISFNPMVVQVTDRFGNPIAGVQVVFRISVGFGTLSSSSGPCSNDVCTVFTDANGFASVVYTSDGGSQGAIAVTATAPSVGTVVFSGLIEAEGGTEEEEEEGGSGGSGGSGGGSGGLAPVLSSLQSAPDPVIAGSPFTLTVTGSNFATSSQVVWGDGGAGADTLAYDTQSATQLVVTVPGILATSASHLVFVNNEPGVDSNNLSLAIP